jgi:hypothetical protein
MKQGFFRLWIIISILWIGLIGCLRWDDIQKAIANRNESSQNDECVMTGLCPQEVIPSVARQALGPPFGLLVGSLAMVWVARGFRREVNARTQKRSTTFTPPIACPRGETLLRVESSRSQSPGQGNANGGAEQHNRMASIREDLRQRKKSWQIFCRVLDKQ